MAQSEENKGGKLEVPLPPHEIPKASDISDIVEKAKSLTEAIRSIVRDELLKFADEPEIGSPYYIVTTDDLEDLVMSLRLGPWQKRRIIYWLDHLRTDRGELPEKPASLADDVQ